MSGPRGEEITDLGPELSVLCELGVDVPRLYPQIEGIAEVMTRFDLPCRSPQPPPCIAGRNDCWHGEPGMHVPKIA